MGEDINEATSLIRTPQVVWIERFHYNYFKVITIFRHSQSYNTKTCGMGDRWSNEAREIKCQLSQTQQIHGNSLAGVLAGSKALTPPDDRTVFVKALSFLELDCKDPLLLQVKKPT